MKLLWLQPIGAHTYKVMGGTGEEMAKRHGSKEKSIDGYWSFEKLEIGVAQDNPLSVRQHTLIHESQHAINHALGIKMTEGQVDGLFEYWLMLLRGNKRMRF